MKFLIFIPFFIFSQTPEHPDSLYLKSGQVHTCIITQIDESRIILKYGKDREITLFLIGVDKIVLNSVGVVYTKEFGFNKEIFQLQQVIEERNNLNLILSNGDIISKFYLQNTIENFITIYQDGKTKFISVESIVAIKRTTKSEFWESAGIGIVIGSLGGLLIGASLSSGSNFIIGPTHEEAAILGGVSGFLIGGIVGASSSEDEICDLTHMTPKRKLKKIREELLKQKESR